MSNEKIKSILKEILSDLEIRVYVVLVSDNFDDDAKTPFNQLTYLEPYHNAIVKYLTWQGKIKLREPADAAKAEADFYGFIKMMTKNIGGGKVSSIRFQPVANMYNPQG